MRQTTKNAKVLVRKSTMIFIGLGEQYSPKEDQDRIGSPARRMGRFNSC
ncbi:MAG: hypothetical protein ACI9RO_001633 [Alteromonas macleodii]|jgi:hypothetical protein